MFVTILAAPSTMCRMSKTKTCTVYSLTDPRDGTIRYIGATSQDRAKRVWTHVDRARRGLTVTPLADWLRELDALGLRPTAATIEAVPWTTQADMDTRERYWITEHRRLGSPLLNVTDGGIGSLGAKRSPESIAKQKATNLAHRDEWLAKVRATKGTPEARQRNSEAIKAKYAADPDYRRRNSEAQKALYAADPDRRHRTAEATRNSFMDPDRRRRQSEALKAFWASQRED